MPGPPTGLVEAATELSGTAVSDCASGSTSNSANGRRQNVGNRDGMSSQDNGTSPVRHRWRTLILPVETDSSQPQAPIVFAFRVRIPCLRRVHGIRRSPRFVPGCQRITFFFFAGLFQVDASIEPIYSAYLALSCHVALKKETGFSCDFPCCDSSLSGRRYLPSEHWRSDSPM